MFRTSSPKPQAARLIIVTALVTFAAGFAAPHAARALGDWPHPPQAPSPKPQAAPFGALSTGAILIAVPEGTQPQYVYTEREGQSCESGRDVWSIPVGSILMPCEVVSE